MVSELALDLAVRLRPLNQREKDKNIQVQWAIDVGRYVRPLCQNSKKIYSDILDDLDFSGEQCICSNFTFFIMQFSCDVYNFFSTGFNEHATNEEIYNEFVCNKIESAMTDFFNYTVIAYGQISSGKTHTMTGTSSDPGVVQLATRQIFSHIRDIMDDCESTSVQVSYFKIYNYTITDLLDPGNTSLRFSKDNQTKMVHIFGSCEKPATSTKDLVDIVRSGDENRRVDEIYENEKNSRSHAILRYFNNFNFNLRDSNYTFDY